MANELDHAAFDALDQIAELMSQPRRYYSSDVDTLHVALAELAVRDTKIKQALAEYKLVQTHAINRANAAARAIMPNKHDGGR